MSIEAFLWNYRSGEAIGFNFDSVREILSTDNTQWSDDNGCLRLGFRDPDSSVDVFLGKQAPITGHVDGIMVRRPLAHPAFLERIFRVMQLGNVMLFYSDETTPVFVRGADPGQYPSDLLKELGEPRFVDAPIDLLHQT